MERCVSRSKMILPHKNRRIDKYKPVEVYRNVNKDGAVWYSIRQSGKVVGHADELSLTQVTFHVQPSGNKRVKKTKVKNVHAWIKGYLSNYAVARIGKRMVRVQYNPLLNDSFVTPTKKKTKKVTKAKSVVFYSGGVLACL